MVFEFQGFKASCSVADKSFMDETHESGVTQRFPWHGKFDTKAEIDNYLAGDKVQCLFCGKWFKTLHQHFGGPMTSPSMITVNDTGCRGGADCVELGPAKRSVKAC